MPPTPSKPLLRQTDSSTNKAIARRSGLRGRSSAILISAFLIWTVLIVLGAWALISQDRARQTRAQQTELASLARALEEHTNHRIVEVDAALRALTSGTAFRAQIQLDDVLRLHADELNNWIERMPQVAALALYTADGREYAVARQKGLSETVVPARPSISIWKKSRASGMRLQQTLRQSGGRWFLPMERALRGSDGELLGIATALISLEYFERFYRDIRLSEADSLTILSQDGYVLLSLPEETSTQERDWSGMLASVTNTKSPTQMAVQPHNGREYFQVFRHLKDDQFIVSAGRPVDVALASFTEMRRRLLLGAAVLILLVAALGAVAYYDARKREVSRLALGRLNASLEERVGRRTAELEQSNRELIAFSYSVSHDLRSPLRAINGFAHALREDYGSILDDQGRDFLERIYRASVRMGVLIDELLSLANVSRAPLNLRPINLSLIANEIIEEMRIANPEREVAFEAQPDLLVEGDEALLRNALSNLLNNAWKFTRARRPAVITFNGVEEEECVRYVVADNGVGFEMAHAKRLFQPFQQLHSNQGYGGTGIGLASVRRIIERHGGTIWAEAMPDQGARFVFTLPLRAQVIRRKRRQRE